MRKSRAKDRIIYPDPKFGDVQVAKFVNRLMQRGKKSVAYNVFYTALDIVAEKTGESGLEVFKKAIENITPKVEVRSRRIGGATFQIPQEVRPKRKVTLANKWMIEFAKKRRGHSMAEKLADEIIAAYKEEGGAFKKKEDTHRMAEANKAFSHFKF
ncbi:MAG: 30S ribosomal protein S7 [Bacteroidetes bacterium]|nr:MAG: 30S ribosomal protein S7 [Bacteroidota bacterium]